MILSVALFLVVVLHFLKNSFMKWQKFLVLASKIPGPKGQIPLIGYFSKSIGSTASDFVTIFKNAYEKIPGAIGKVWHGPLLFITIKSPEAAQIVLNSKDCLDKPFFFKNFKIQEGSVFGTLDAWQRHRKIMNPGFSLRVVRSYFPTFNENSKKFMGEFNLKCDGKEFDIFPYVTAFIIDNNFSTIFDIQYDFLKEKDKFEYSQYIDEYEDSYSTRSIKPWLYFDFIYNFTNHYKMERFARNKAVTKFTDLIYKKYKSEEGDDFVENENEIKNPIKLLMDPKLNLNQREINDELDSIVMASQNSTSISISNTLLALAMHQDVQQKVVDEIKQFFPCVDEPIDYETLNQLTYLDMVIKETLRILPTGFITFRYLANDLKVGDYILPAGSNIALCMYDIQNNKKYWGEDADLFIPERFEPERMKNIHPYAYIPFSAGPRNCIGMNFALRVMKIFLINFLRHYELDTTLKLNEIKFKIGIALKVDPENRMSLKKRIF